MMKKAVYIGVFALMLLLGLLAAGLAGAQTSADDFSRFERDWPFTDFSQASVSAGEIQRGGPPIDGIPPYYPPNYRYPDSVPYLGGGEARFFAEYVSLAETDAYLPDEQPVIAVAIGEEAHAYPLILLNNHEIVNTSLGGVPIAVTFCPLCNASIVYERQIGQRIYHFGVTGLLRKSDLVMWDHETQSWWQQFTGEAIVGALLGTRLEQVPSVVVSWGQFKAEYPQGLVLKSPRSDPLSNISYRGYDVSGNTFLFEGETDPRLFATERVLGYFGPEGAVAYPFSRLAEVGVVNDSLGGEKAVVFWQGQTVSLFSPEMEIGSAALYRAVLEDGRALTFIREADGTLRDEQTNSRWNVFGRAIEGELAGTRLEQRFAYPHFWFAWAAFRPETLIWQAGQISDEVWAGQ
jgi:hypothetical protein